MYSLLNLLDFKNKVEWNSYICTYGGTHDFISVYLNPNKM